MLCTCEAKKRLNSFGGETNLEQQIIRRSYNAFHETNLGNAFKSFCSFSTIIIQYGINMSTFIWYIHLNLSAENFVFHDTLTTGFEQDDDNTMM